jgi:hypothetical protein
LRQRATGQAETDPLETSSILIHVIATARGCRQGFRMRPDDLFYYLGRAEEELELAYEAVHEAARRAHALLAGYYFDLAYGGDERPDEGAGSGPGIPAG